MTLLDDRQLLRFDPFEGDKDGPTAEFLPRVVRTRKPHTCGVQMDPHQIPVGARAVVYTWIEGRKVHRLYCCEVCIEAWLTGEGDA